MTFLFKLFILLGPFVAIAIDIAIAVGLRKDQRKSVGSIMLLVGGVLIVYGIVKRVANWLV